MKKMIYFLLLISLSITLISCQKDDDIETYTVSFQTNSSFMMPDMIVYPNQMFFPEMIPIKENHLFLGWYLDQELFYPMSFQIGVNQNTTLYAKYELIQDLLTESEIRSIIDQILLTNDIKISDAHTINQIVYDLIILEQVIDQELVTKTVIDQINFLNIYQEQISNMLVKVKQATVSIGRTNGTYGSGVIYKKEGNRYFVLTSEHLLYGATNNAIYLNIYLKNATYFIQRGLVKLHSMSKQHDLAVLSFESDLNIEPLSFGTLESINVGDTVFAVGSPLNYSQSVSSGIISYLSRRLDLSSGFDSTTLQHTAFLNRGNSGGPLVDVYGNIIGINSRGHDTLSDHTIVQGIQFAIQINMILTYLDSLEQIP
jgi:S1-C subfamily serine protease